MIKGIGIDLIELDRIRKSMENNSRLAKRILTDDELAVFEQFVSDKRKVEFLAGRFAAKEAFAKATGRGLGKLSFKHIEILSGESGAPVLSARGYEDDKVFLSISHSDHYAIAQVIIS